MKESRAPVSIKLWTLNIIIILSAMLGVFTAYELKKGASLHDLNFLHLKHNIIFFDNVLKFKDGILTDTTKLSQSVEEIRQQPVSCLEEIGWVEEKFMRAISTYNAMKVCEEDIMLADTTLAMIESYNNGQTSKETLVHALEHAKQGFEKHSAEFGPLVDDTVSQLFTAVIFLVLAKATLVVLVGAYLSRAVARDYRKLEQKDMRIKESRAFLELIMDNNPDFIFVKDENFRIVQANSAFFGFYSPERRDSIIGTTTIEEYDEQEAEAFLKQDKKAFKDGYSETVEKIQFPDGRTRTLYTIKIRFENAKNEPFILAIARDITDLRQAEDALAGIGRILEESLSEVYIIDAETLKFLQVNRGARQNIGYSMEELRAMTPFDIKPRYDKESLSALINPLIDGTKEKVIIETLHQRKDGSFYDIEAHLQLGEYQGRKVFVAMVLDTSDRKKSEEQQLKLMDHLTQSNTDLERFAYVASHDMQEPIRMIINFSQILSDNYDDILDEEGQEYLSLLVEHGKRMRDMVYDLLEYARVGNGTMNLSDVDANSEVTHVLDNLDQLIHETGTEVTFDSLPTFHGNAIQFSSLLQNLIANGIKYQPEGSVPHIHIHAKSDGDFWRFSIKDNGIGIHAKHRQDIFQPFKRLHNQESFKGTGLGLASCGRIVENHGGKIWVESVLGEGSVFYFTIAKSLKGIEKNLAS